MSELSEDHIRLTSFTLRTACHACIEDAGTEAVDIRSYVWNLLYREYWDESGMPAFCCLLKPSHCCGFDLHQPADLWGAHGIRRFCGTPEDSRTQSWSEGAQSITREQESAPGLGSDKELWQYYD